MNLLSDLRDAGMQLGQSAIGGATSVVQKQIDNLTGNNTVKAGVQSQPESSIPAAFARAQGMAFESNYGLPNIVWLGVGVLALAYVIKKVK